MVRHRLQRGGMKRLRVAMLPAVLPAAFAVLATPPASAHPHVWVSTRAEVIYENGAITGLRHTWVFDEFYTTGAIEGLDKNGDGKVDRAELAELTKINIEGLKEFEYFTAAKFGDKPLEFADARDAVMDVVETPEAPGPQGILGGDTPAKPSGGVMGTVGGWWSKLVTPAPSTDLAKLLVIDFVLPLKQAIPAGGAGFSFTVTDPSMFIWLEQARIDPIKLSPGAPKGCGAVIGAVQFDEEQKRLNDAFGQGGLPVVGGAKTVTITCGK